MRRKRSQSPYRIVGWRGEWFAWKPGFSLQGWWAHVHRISVVTNGQLCGVTAVLGRTPFEALERLKKLEARAC
jgi:hypothetical protein